jgi:hypothetical protein
MAAHLACNTGLSSQAALGILATSPEASERPNALAAAMDREPRPAVGADGGRSAQAPGQRLLAATQDAVKVSSKRR